MKEKKHWNRRVLSFFLALAMVITQLGVWNAGKESVQAAENSSFTLYYYNESKEPLYVNIWSWAGISFAEDVEVTSEFGWISITGRGTVATGRVEAGVLHVSEEVEIVGIKEETRKVVVTGIEMFRKLLDEAQAGDNIGALLRGVQRNEIERGQVLAKPGTLTCHTKFTAQVYVLTKDEGGRHTPFFNNYRPQFYFRTTDVTGVCNLPEGTEMCMPGDNIEMTIELIHPIAMSQGLTFAIREGGRTVGSGRVATIIE